MILVGTKLDLREDPKELQRLAERRMSAITYQQGAQCAREIGAIKYLEVSAEFGCHFSSPPSVRPDQNAEHGVLCLLSFCPSFLFCWLNLCDIPFVFVTGFLSHPEGPQNRVRRGDQGRARPTGNKKLEWWQEEAQQELCYSVGVGREERVTVYDAVFVSKREIDVCSEFGIDHDGC